MNEVDQKQQYEDFEEMFQTAGWKELMKLSNEMHKNIMDSAVNAAPSNDQWQFLRGQVTQLETLIQFEPYIVNTMVQMDAEANSDEYEVSDLEA